MKTVVNFLALFLLLSTLSTKVSAKLIEPEGLQQKIIESYSKVSQFKVDLASSVFDPEGFRRIFEDVEDVVETRELINASFTQKVFWVRDEYFGIETFGSLGLPAIILFQEGHKQVVHNLQPYLNFHPKDILFTHFIFYTKFVSNLESSLHDLGIPTDTIGLVQRDNRILYRLGSLKENILIDGDLYRVLEINRQIQIDGEYYNYKISFSNWDKIKKRIPKLTQHYINSRLIKEVNVMELQFRNISHRRSKFLSRYKSHLPQKPSLPLGLNFAQ
ncbi:MAG: hypothetical protein GY786_20660 [Proteobacteria bacterium]|nr:hypothetical protein [Pseudomonadota bacterium]